MNIRKIAIVLLSLLILLPGCSSSNAPGDIEESANGQEISSIHTGEGLIQQNEKADDSDVVESSTDNDISESGKEKTDESIPEDRIRETEGNTSKSNKEEAGEKENKNGNEKDNIIELIPMAQLPDLTLDPQPSITRDDMYGTQFLLFPVYHDTFRYQIREYRLAHLVVDFGNTGSETLVITDEDLYFSILDSEGKDCAGSKVHGAPVRIAPGEIKRVVVTAKHPEAGFVFFNVGGQRYTLTSPMYRALPHEQKDIVDTTPYKRATQEGVVDGMPYVVALKPMEVIGNGKAKAMGSGLMVVENKEIGPIRAGDKGFIALVRVKIANTSNETMNIDKLLLSHADDKVDVLRKEDLAALGDKALPFTVEPQSIVEGWVPLKVESGHHFYGVNIYSNLGIFIIGDIQGYPIF